jgi:hypothetical protein
MHELKPQYPFEWNFELSSPDLRREDRERLNEEKLDKQNKLLTYLAE